MIQKLQLVLDDDYKTVFHSSIILLPFSSIFDKVRSTFNFGLFGFRSGRIVSAHKGTLPPSVLSNILKTARIEDDWTCVVFAGCFLSLR